MMELFAELDPTSLAAIARMEDPELLNPAIINMLQQSVDNMQIAATNYMYASFIDPGSGVENAWETQVQSSTLATLTNTALYARRLNEGFSGMTDSLGRYFPYWPAYHWAEAAVEASAPDVENIFALGIEKTLGEISG
jgi:hypothetical protein